MKRKRIFGELELAIMRTFEENEMLTVRGVLGLLRSGDKYTTVMTIMNRMVEKKMLIRERNGQHYEYWMNRSDRKKVQPSFFEKLKQKIFGGSSASMVSYLLETSHDITDKEIREMEQMIKNLKKSRKNK